ncbi:hypothetical protein HOI71_22400 [Candidatus Poribacteria bacterium]|nr:hypothetical protein [Candidatus Poribacteria bacterium]
MKPRTACLRCLVSILPLLHIAGVAGGQTLTWEPTAGPYGGTVTVLYEAADGLLLAGTETAGVYVSADGGLTWRHSSEGMGNRFVRAFTHTDDALFAGTSSRGVYRSEDGGATWARTGYGLRAAGNLASAGGRLLATDSALWGFLQSDDGGSSWALAPVATGPALVHSGSLHGSGNTLYAAGTAPNGSRVIWRSRDAGEGWERGLAAWGRPLGSFHVEGDAVYVGQYERILRSSDGGNSWQGGLELGYLAIVNALTGKDGRLFVGTKTGLFRMNADGEGMVRTAVPGPRVDVPAVLAVGDHVVAAVRGSGLWRSGDGFETWAQMGLANTDVRRLAAADGIVYAGTAGAVVFLTGDHGDRWVSVGAEADALAILGAGGRTVYAMTQTGVIRSDDTGSTWRSAPAMDAPAAMLIEPSGVTLIGATGVHLSTDDGATWSLVGAWDASVHDIARTAEGYVAAASDGVHLSSANGAQWRPTGLSGVGAHHVYSDAGVLWAATSSELFRSADAGETWDRLPLGGPDTTIEDITGSNGYLYVSGSGGVFGSADLGNSWAAVGAGLPDTRVAELLVYDGILYAATDNAGVYRAAIPAAATPKLTILSPAPEQVVPGEAGETVLRVATPTGATRWHWRLARPFASTGAAGGAPGLATGIDTIEDLPGGTHTVFVTLVDASGNVLDPAAQDSVTFHVAADPDAPAPAQRVRHAYEMPRGLSLFSPVLDGDRLRTADVSLDLPSTDGLHASHLAAIGSTVVVDLGEDGFRTVIARDGRILYGADFPLSGERGYVVNFQTPLTFTLEGEPYGTPIITDAVAAAPSAAPEALWAFAVGVRVVAPSASTSGLRARVRNARTGDERTAPVGPDGVAVIAFVDMDRDPMVALGDALTIDVLATDGWALGAGVTTRVSPALLADAHAVADISVAPSRTALLANYPNPFNPETWMPFELAEGGDVTLTLYNVDGRRVRAIALGRREAGYHGARTGAVRWDGRNEQGEAVASGAYVAELRVGATRSARRILLVR